MSGTRETFTSLVLEHLRSFVLAKSSYCWLSIFFHVYQVSFHTFPHFTLPYRTFLCSFPPILFSPFLVTMMRAPEVSSGMHVRPEVLAVRPVVFRETGGYQSGSTVRVDASKRRKEGREVLTTRGTS